MAIELFSDLIDVLGKVANSIKSMAEFSAAERDKIRQTLDETYRLIDSTLNMVIVRLGDIKLEEEDGKFLAECFQLDNYNDWMQVERDFRLCRALRVALREMETLKGKLASKVSAKDWDTLLYLMNSIIATEGEVAMFISQKFRQLADEARAASEGSPAVPAIRSDLQAFRSALIDERQALIQQEITLYDVV